MKSKEIPRCTNEELAGRDNGGAAGMLTMTGGNGFEDGGRRASTRPPTGWEKPQPAPMLLFGAMASDFSDETVLGPNVCKVLPNPTRAMWTPALESPRGQGEGGRALCPRRDLGQLECEGNGARGPQPSVKAPLQGCGKTSGMVEGGQRPSKTGSVRPNSVYNALEAGLAGPQRAAVGRAARLPCGRVSRERSSLPPMAAP